MNISAAEIQGSWYEMGLRCGRSRVRELCIRDVRGDGRWGSQPRYLDAQSYRKRARAAIKLRMTV